MRCAPPYMLRYRTRVRTCCGLVALAFGGFHRSIEKGVTCGIRRPVTGEMRLMRETWRTATGAIREGRRRSARLAALNTVPELNLDPCHRTSRTLRWYVHHAG